MRLLIFFHYNPRNSCAISIVGRNTVFTGTAFRLVYCDENQSELKYKSTVQTLTEQGSLDYPPLFSYVPSEYLGWKQYWECIHSVVLVSNVPLVGIQWKEYFAQFFFYVNK